MHEELIKRADEIGRWNKKLKNGITLRLITTGTPQSDVIEEFTRDFAALAPMISLEEEERGDGDLPGIYINESWRLHFVPEAREFAPFLDLLSAVSGEQVDIGSETKKALENHSDPLKLTLFISTQCPNCPKMMRQVAPLPLFNAQTQLQVIDGMLFPELAAEYRIKSVPGLIGEGGIRWTGQIDLDEVLGALFRSNQGSFDKETLERMIIEGDAESLTDMIIRTGRIMPPFLEVLTHEHFSTRLGAMVVMEELKERAPELASTALEPLWQRISEFDEAIKGDIVYLIGENGGAEWIPTLESFSLDQPAGDLKDAIQDSLETLLSRQKAQVISPFIR